MKVKKADIAALLAGTFPEYSGRKFFVEAAERVTLYDLNWCEGVRNSYQACTISGKTIGCGQTFNQTAPWNNKAEGATIQLPAGAIVACHAFHGQHESVTFYINPADMPKLLPMVADTSV